MALKPFYNKKGHLGMTRQQLLEKLNGGGVPSFDTNDLGKSLTVRLADDNSVELGWIRKIEAAGADLFPSQWVVDADNGALICTPVSDSEHLYIDSYSSAVYANDTIYNHSSDPDNILYIEVTNAAAALILAGDAATFEADLPTVINKIIVTVPTLGPFELIRQKDTEDFTAVRYISGMGPIIVYFHYDTDISIMEMTFQQLGVVQ